MKRSSGGLTSIAIVVGLLASFAGCSHFRNCAADAKLKHLAKASYRDSEAAAAFEGYQHDFKKGYEQGYFDVAQGANGAPPPLPPDHYWGPHFQNPEGHERIKSWFAGYAAGAVAAGNDGMQHFNFLPSPHRDLLPAYNKDPYESTSPPMPATEDVMSPEVIDRPYETPPLAPPVPAEPDDDSLSLEPLPEVTAGLLPFGVLPDDENP